MSDDSNSAWRSSNPSDPPPHPLNAMWYVEGPTETFGPCDGRAVVQMIQQGTVGPTTGVARVGATEWIALADVPLFAHALRSRSGAAPPINAGAAENPVYAGFWIRAGAYLLDCLIVAAVSFVVGVIIGIITAGVDLAQGKQLGNMALMKDLATGAGYVLALFYFIYFPCGRWQATPGKKMVGIHIVRLDGQRVSGWLAFGRYLAYIISSIPLGIGFFMIGWTEQKKALHDILCGTRVVYGRL